MFSSLRQSVAEIARQYWLAELLDLVVRVVLLNLVATIMGESLLSKQIGLRLADAIFFAVAKRTFLLQLAIKLVGSSNS